MFDSSENFDAWVDLSTGHVDTAVIEQLHRLLAPFMIRRVKKDVEKGIPPKTETKLFVGLTDMQKRWYR